MKLSPNNLMALGETKDGWLPVNDLASRPHRKCSKPRANPTSHRKTRINSISKETLKIKVNSVPSAPQQHECMDTSLQNNFIYADDTYHDTLSNEFDDPLYL